MEELLRRFNPWWEKNHSFEGISRHRYLESLSRLESTKDVILITGLRRVGKTTLMKQYIHHLLERVEPRKVMYVSLDNIAIKDESIQEIVDAFRTINSLEYDEHVFLFLDEVHFKKDFELELKNLYDMSHSKVYASGSANLDITLKSPHLTGRQRILRLHPLSFSEYLEFTDTDVSPANTHLLPSKAVEYVNTGGLPEYVLRRDPNILQALLDTILYRDIAERAGIRNRENVKDVLLMIARSVSTPISPYRIARALGMKDETVSRIIDLFRESSLIHVVEKDGKLPERKGSPKKYYLADTGLFNVLADEINLGSKVENAVHLALFRSGPEPIRYYRKDRSEVDFVQDGSLIESKYRSEITVDDISRLKGPRGYRSRKIVSFDKESDRDGVEIQPLWKFLWAHE